MNADRANRFRSAQQDSAEHFPAKWEPVAARKCSNLITCAYSGRKTGTYFCGVRANIFQNRNRLSSVSCENASQEIVMASSRTRLGLSQLAFASAVVTALSASTALASQGPGGGPGTASSFTQLAMAILVYGVSAAVVAAGLIGAARQRSH
jgi:hypothetical protein